MARTEKTEITVLCLIYDSDKILIQNRVKKDWFGYVLPGGHVEKNESFVDAVKREMKEETGYTILNPKLCGIKQFPTKKGVRYIVILFKTNQYEGELVSSDEGEMIWVKREHLKDLNLVDDFMELLRVFDSDDLNEFIYVMKEDGRYVPVLK